MTCSGCGAQSAPPYTAGGVCLRCLGLRVLTADAPQGGRTVGPYEIIEELGRGGMGIVYAARQIGLGRIVALKAIPDDSARSPETQLRFLREAQTVARLRHPGIIAVYESGQADGHSYFSMEYIEGGDLAARLRVERYPARQAAVLMHDVAAALGHAHAHGVLHRDLKPSNILLGENGPKLADFGLAAELDAGNGLTVATTVMGTPHYLAPEALARGSRALSASSDIYALGVIFFELLTGRTPFAGAGPAELAGLASQNDAPAVRLIAPAVPRDLETICARCLEREPARRYSSAAAVEADLRRFQAGEPIHARPPGVWERTTKFARRNRVPVAAAAVVAAVLVAATVVSVSLAIRAEREQHRKQIALDEAAAVSQFLSNELLGQASPDSSMTLRQAVEMARGRIDGRFAGQPQAEAEVRMMLGDAYSMMGDPATAEVEYRRCRDLLLAADGPDESKTLRAGIQLSGALMKEQKLTAADQLLTDVLARCQRVYGGDNEETLTAENYLVYVLKAEGRLGPAEHAAADVLERSLRTVGEKNPQSRNAMSNLSSVYYSEGKYADAETLNVRALALHRQWSGPENYQTLTAMANLGSLYWAEGKLAQAEALDRELLAVRQRVTGAGHPETLRTLHALGNVLMDGGKYAEAAALLREAYAGRLKLLGPAHQDTTSSMASLGACLAEIGQKDEALRLGRQAADTAERASGPNHFITVAAFATLAGAERQLGELAAAERDARSALRRRAASGAERNIATAGIEDTLGRVLLAQKNYRDAEAVLREAVAIYRDKQPQSWKRFAAEKRWSAALAGIGRNAEAQPLRAAAELGLAAHRAEVPARYKDILAPG